jgi:hypothetical protein
VVSGQAIFYLDRFSSGEVEGCVEVSSQAVLNCYRPSLDEVESGVEVSSRSILDSDQSLTNSVAKISSATQNKINTLDWTNNCVNPTSSKNAKCKKVLENCRRSRKKPSTKSKDFFI